MSKQVLIEYWHNGELMGLVEQAGAEYIKRSAAMAGCRIDEGEFYFNVEL